MNKYFGFFVGVLIGIAGIVISDDSLIFLGGLFAGIFLSRSDSNNEEVKE